MSRIDQGQRMIVLDSLWLPNGIPAAMPTIRTVHDTDQVKVAVVFEQDQIRPVWFQVAGKDPVRISQICATWYCTRGATRIINFEIWDSREKYSLAYNTQTLAWSLGRTVIE